MQIKVLSNRENVVLLWYLIYIMYSISGLIVWSVEYFRYGSIKVNILMNGKSAIISLEVSVRVTNDTRLDLI